jgi:hypothetical protein
VFPDEPRRKAAALIAENLTTGLEHPGEPGKPPFTIVLPMFRTTGMPPQMAVAVQTSTARIAEAIVHLLTVKNDLRLIPAEDSCRTSA